MALSNEDHKDVKKAMGKAIANKITKVTRDDFRKRGLWITKTGKKAGVLKKNDDRAGTYR
jgi:hypothetical protein